MSKIKNGGSDQYGAECFGRLIFARIRKSVALKRLTFGADHIQDGWERKLAIFIQAISW